MSELTLRIEGMSCDHCVRRVTQALGRALEGAPAGTPGAAVKQVRVGSAVVEYDGRPESSQALITALVAALDRAGYAARAEPDVTKTGPVPDVTTTGSVTDVTTTTGTISR